VIREKEADKKFRKLLQNPPHPINDTSTSPEMKKYLDDLNNGTLNKKKEKKVEEDNTPKLFCPTCRKSSLKRNAQGYMCYHCGLFTNSPLSMARR